MKPVVRTLTFVFVLLFTAKLSLLSRAQTPTGRFYLSASSNAYNASVFGTNLDGSNTVAFTGYGPRAACSPSLSSDGSLIAFNETDSWYSTNGPNIWLCNGDGSNPRQLTTTPSGLTAPPSDNHPCISPDGTVVAFSSDRTPETAPNGTVYDPYELYLVSTSGAGVTQLTTSDLNYGPNNVTNVVFSPDGKTILFCAYGITCTGLDGSYGYQGGVFSIQSDGTGLKQIVFADAGFALDWSRDGRYILYGTTNDGNIHVRDMTNNTETVFPWPTYTEGPDSVRFSPDGTQIAISEDNGQPLLIVDHSGNVLKSIPQSTIFAKYAGWGPYPGGGGLWWQNEAPIPTPKKLVFTTTVKAKVGQAISEIPVLKDAKGNVIAQVPFWLTIQVVGGTNNNSVWDAVKYILTPNPGTEGVYQVKVNNAGLTASQTLYWGTPKINKVVITSSQSYGNGSFILYMDIYNNGTGAAVNFTITSITVNGIAGTINGPSYIQTLDAGSYLYTDVTFPTGTLATGVKGTLKVTGTYMGGKFSISQTITGP